MNVQKILCLASLICFTTILPTLLPTEAETLSQDSVEISKEKSSRDGQHRESKDDKDDHDAEHDYHKDRDDHKDRDHHRDDYKDRDHHRNDDHYQKERH